MYALLVWAGLSQRSRLWLSLSVSALLGAGMLFTYSRGALVASGLGLLAALLAARSHHHPARGPRLALLTLLAATAAFTASGEVFRLRLESEGTERWYGARYEPEQASLTLEPREARRVRVRVTNTGRKTWAREEAFHLSYHWYHVEKKTLQDGGRTELPADVPPQASVVLDPQVVAPDLPGRYRLVWDMVHEHTTWFSGYGVRPVVVDAVVGTAGAAAPAPAQLSNPGMGWRPGRRELWRLALAMWQAHPVLGVGPDNFRWFYGRQAGEPFWDTRVFANNTLLEAAATTGSLGLVALALTLTAALATSYRGLKAAPDAERLALFGVTVAVLAHGAFDYVLAFTGHYLFLGFLIGSIEAPRESDLT
jgi:O-antigen ligase